MNTDEDQPVGRRISLRRSRGFGGGASTRTESLRATDHVDTEGDDDVINPEVVHQQIVRTARTRPTPRATLPAPPAAGFSHAMPRDNDGVPPPSPADRMGEVAQAGSAAFAIEYRLTMLHRLLMRNIPLDQIARQLGVSISTVEKDRVKLKARLRATARELDINEIVGNQMGMYGEISGMALRVATDGDTPIAMRLAAMRTTLAAEADRTRFLNSAGVLDVLRYRKSEDGTDVSDVQMLMESTEAMLTQIMAEPTTPTVQRRGRTPPRRDAGFGGMSMGDRDASNSSAENVEL